MFRSIDYSLYFITDESVEFQSSLRIVENAIKGGARMVQFRNKIASTAVLVNQGRQLKTLVKKYNVPLIVNDRIDVALAIGADGVHLGQDDMPASIARRTLGREKIIGVSVKTVAQAKQAAKMGADYLGAGDIFGTKSKCDAGRPIGIKRLSQIAKSVSIPVVGIGGINADNAALVIKTGAAGIAVISAISRARNPEKAARELHSIVIPNLFQDLVTVISSQLSVVR